MFRVINLPKADADVSSIFEYIYSKSARGAETWLNAYQYARKRLAVNADSCPLKDESHRFEIEVRESLFSTRHGKPYRLIFTIAGDEVRILRVRGPGQSAIDPGDI